MPKFKGYLTYLATPFTLYDDGLAHAAVEATILAGRLLQAGIAVYSPIAYTWRIAETSGLDHLDLSIWLPLEERMCAACDVLIVGKLAGWDKSEGIRREVIRFEQRRKPIWEVDPVSLSMAQRRYAMAEEARA